MNSLIERAEALLPDVREKLNITWEDPGGDLHLAAVIAGGIAFMDRLAGRALSYDKGTAALSLLGNYCMYEQAGALDMFAENYRKLLITLNMDEMVIAYARDKAANEDTDV